MEALLERYHQGLPERDPVFVKARAERAKEYPTRFPVPTELTWDDVTDDNYTPPEFTSQRVFEMDSSKDPSNPKLLWADPPEISRIERVLKSYEGEIRYDSKGYPLNPKGPTGLAGRGILGKWGPNFAADPVVTRINNGKLEMITINRSDSGEVAIPGGMVDNGERVTETLKRELGEETSVQLDFENAEPVYCGYVDDPRNTDNAWMETDAFHLHLDEYIPLEPKAGSDAREAKWRVIDTQLLTDMYASHSNTVALAVKNWQERTGKIVGFDGTVY